MKAQKLVLHISVKRPNPIVRWFKNWLSGNDITAPEPEPTQFREVARRPLDQVFMQGHYISLAYRADELIKAAIKNHIYFDQQYRKEKNPITSRYFQEEARQSLNTARSAAARQKRYRELARFYGAK